MEVLAAMRLISHLSIAQGAPSNNVSLIVSNNKASNITMATLWRKKLQIKFKFEELEEDLRSFKKILYSTKKISKFYFLTNFILIYWNF